MTTLGTIAATGTRTVASEDRIELILQQVNTLPTLSSVATRLLRLTSNDEADLREIVRIIESDPTLTARVLALCRRANVGTMERIRTVDRAVVMLGFEAIRNAVLSVEVYDLLSDGAETVESENDEDAGTFDRTAFWKHSVAVAAAAYLLAEQVGKPHQITPDEAFVCGLLHDLGKIVLDRLLPKTYQRIAETANRQAADIAEVERRIIGVDHHTVGRRLAEQWQLPHILQDVMWLHGQTYDTLPDVPHRPMIALVGLADVLARKQHVGYSGNHVLPSHLDRITGPIRITPKIEKEIVRSLHEEVSLRAQALGLGEIPSPQLLAESIARANRSLGRVNESLAVQTRAAARHEQALRAIATFHDRFAHGPTVASTCAEIVRSAANEMGTGFYAMLTPLRDRKRWQLTQFQPDGRMIRHHVVEPLAGQAAIEALADQTQWSMAMVEWLPWLTDLLVDAGDLRRVRLMPLRCGLGMVGVLLHDHDLQELGFTRCETVSLSQTWAAALASAAQYEGSQRLGEQLAEANRTLTETQARLARSQVMAALGEMAAGAAHEMNNPLTVISGRSQVLATQVRDPKHNQMIKQIVEQAHRLSDLITSLHLFAEPPRPSRKRVVVEDIVQSAVKRALERRKSPVPISLKVATSVSLSWLDPEHVTLALIELIVNACEAEPKQIVEVRAEVEKESDRLVLTVRDDGKGMTAHAREHAFDPFYSEKRAGRQPGLGLSRAQRFVEGLGGRIDLRSEPGVGTTARIEFSDWRVPQVD